MNKDIARKLLHQFNFKTLFLDELGWDDHDESLTLAVGDKTVTLDAIAAKRGMGAYLCTMPRQGCSYDYSTRRKIEAELTKRVREHLIIYIDSDRTFQIWQWVKRETGKPIACREHTFTANQFGEALLQKIGVLEVKIEEEEQLTLFGVTDRARQAFDVDRVTKRFYDRFKIEHAAFLKQIKGIADKDDREWYASIMLNRLKFVYFIQKKGFLDRDTDYLRNRLTMIQQTRSKTKFLSFYQAFLLKLFHDGLGCRERSAELRNLLGTIPYLNGGIFAVHPLEEKHTEIDIPDEAFSKVFDFFDQYHWHLDERPLRADNEINPDVLGYIFEKYINQKQMGAYYTKEDITEYIAKNCMIPHILDRVEASLKKKPAAFRELFQHLAADPDRYIYDAVKHGVELSLPPEIEKGVDPKKPDLMERRAAWNEPAPSEYALPTEIWREVVARRQRYTDIRAQLSAMASDPSTPFQANDLITLNLNIRQFAQDCIENAAAPDVLWAFWQAIEQITVLDPTCGSGAFLFAAVNVLEPLYEACLDRMKAFMLEWSQAQKVPHPNYYKDFAAVIARVEKHATEKYFIFKSIIIQNLYGVDIMDEAVEICKLRLFLKLAAQLEPDYAQDNLGIEPLPDIDFNIRAGNTLVGFATEKQAEDVISQDLLAYNTVWPEVKREVLEIAEMFEQFRRQQTELGGAINAADKKRLHDKLAPLEERLNTYLAGTYGITAKKDIQKWVHSHKPFHWFSEFYAIMARGGFDAVIGNPPYVSTSKVRYLSPEQRATKFSDIYALVVLRSLDLSEPQARCGMILPLSITFSKDFGQLRAKLCASNAWFTSFDNIPAAVFAGVSQRCTIWIGAKQGQRCFASPMYRWRSVRRPSLVTNIEYHLVDGERVNQDGLPKLCTRHSAQILRALDTPHLPRRRDVLAVGTLGVKVGFSQSARNFISVFLHTPPCLNAASLKSVEPSDIGTISCSTSAASSVALMVLAGEFFFLYWLTRGDGFHVTVGIVKDFLECLSYIPDEHFALLGQLGHHLDKRRNEALVFKKNAGKYVGNYNYRGHFKLTRRADLLLMAALSIPKNQALEILDYVQRILAINEHAGEKAIPDEVKSKFTPGTIDQSDQAQLFGKVDAVLAKHYGFTDEELDFIINYDIKYRVGVDGDKEE